MSQPLFHIKKNSQCPKKLDGCVDWLGGSFGATLYTKLSYKESGNNEPEVVYDVVYVLEVECVDCLHVIG